MSNENEEKTIRDAKHLVEVFSGGPKVSNTFQNMLDLLESKEIDNRHLREVVNAFRLRYPNEYHDVLHAVLKIEGADQ